MIHHCHSAHQHTLPSPNQKSKDGPWMHRGTLCSLVSKARPWIFDSPTLCRLSRFSLSPLSLLSESVVQMKTRSPSARPLPLQAQALPAPKAHSVSRLIFYLTIPPARDTKHLEGSRYFFVTRTTSSIVTRETFLSNSITEYPTSYNIPAEYSSIHSYDVSM